MIKVAVLADTHTMRASSPAPSRPLPPGAWPYIETADQILSTCAPVSVVMGNCDSWDVREWGARDELTVRIGEVEVAMLHDAGPARGRRSRMDSRFPAARAVVFGHSHLPWNEDENGLLLFNPGSPTWKRRAPFLSMGMLWIDGRDVEGEVFPV
jgi:predicted phosphodiesterase